MQGTRGIPVAWSGVCQDRVERQSYVSTDQAMEHGLLRIRASHLLMSWWRSFKFICNRIIELFASHFFRRAKFLQLLLQSAGQESLTTLAGGNSLHPLFPGYRAGINPVVQWWWGYGIAASTQACLPSGRDTGRVRPRMDCFNGCFASFFSSRSK